MVVVLISDTSPLISPKKTKKESGSVLKSGNHQLDHDLDAILAWLDSSPTSLGSWADDTSLGGIELNAKNLKASCICFTRETISAQCNDCILTYLVFIPVLEKGN